MKHSAILSLFFLLAACAPEAGVPADYDQPWNVPTFGLRQADERLYYFGQIGAWDREFVEDTLFYPDIPGLYHRSAYHCCPADTCYADYLTLALRCPGCKSLLRWLGNRVCSFLGEVPIPSEYSWESVTCKYFTSAEETCDYYIDCMAEMYAGKACPHNDAAMGGMNNQAGLLLVDCWRAGSLCTFCEVAWDYRPKLSYRTVDSRTGRELKLEDFVLESKYGELYKKVKFYLKNEHGERWVDQLLEPEVYDESLLTLANGCALIREGFIIYYYPYNIGCGADGEYTAVIPYAEMAGLLKPGIARQVLSGC